MADSLDRLKSQLLTSGLQQENIALFQVISQLIDYLRGNINAVNQAVSGSGGGGGGGVGLLGATYLTKNKEVGLPNSLQTLPGAGIQFNDANGRRIISTAIPFAFDGEQGDEGVPGPPGRIGIDGIPGVDGAPGKDGVSMLTIDGEDGIDGEPGLPGATGGTGPAGAAGPQGTSGSTSGPPYIEPEEPEYPYIIPGPIGPAGGGGGSSEWDIIKTKTVNDTVNNSVVLVDDSELITPLANNSSYYGEWAIIYSGNNATGDYTFTFRMGGNVTITAQFKLYVLYSALALGATASAFVSANSGVNAVCPTPSVGLGTDAADSKILHTGYFVIHTPAAWAGDGKLAYQFALNAAAVGRICTTYAGSYFRLKKLA